MTNIGIRNLCTPASIYLVISMIALIIIFLQNMNNPGIFCLGNYSCESSNTNLIFIVKFIYIILWTWILNLICKAGAPMFSWILLLFPVVFMFIFLAMFFTYNVANIPTSFT